jgi:hypothetical protein
MKAALLKMGRIFRAQEIFTPVFYVLVRSLRARGKSSEKKTDRVLQ